MRRPRLRLLGPILGLGLLTAALIVPTTAAAAQTCDEGSWPAATQGTPVTWKSGARAGEYIWHNSNGWHVRVTHPSSRKIMFSGRIIADQPMTVKGVRLEGSDSFALSADKKTLTYHFANYGNIDGLDIRTACATTLRIRGNMAGEKLRVGRIVIGRTGVHPLSNPFVIARQP